MVSVRARPLISGLGIFPERLAKFQQSSRQYSIQVFSHRRADLLVPKFAFGANLLFGGVGAVDGGSVNG